MKRVISILSLIFLLLLPATFPFTVSAQQTQELSLSDAVLADLALHNYLDYVSIDFKDKQSPNTITINQDRQWLPASTVKLFVAMYAADQIDKKNISLDQWVTIDAKNVVPTELETGDYPVLTDGLTTTVDNLLGAMITQSDNTAYNTLLDLLDRQKITEYVQGLGLTHTIVGSKLNLDDNQTQYEYTIPGFNINTTTAADYEMAYELIDNNKIPGSKLLFDILKKQKIQNMIPEFLPAKQLTIAHKTGDLDPLYHDGGIIVGNNRHYILTIFTNLGNPYVLAHISQLIFTKNYKLVGATIPDKSTTNPQTPQALDPLVVNPEGFKAVLAATTQINVPIPQITAADLGITAKELSLVLPDSKLPRAIISPTSPLHALVPLWYGTQTLFALGEKNRQHVALTYAEQLIADAKQLQKQGANGQVSAYMQNVQSVLNSVATDKAVKPDAETQLEIQAASQTQFAVLKNQVDKTANDTERIALLQQVANQAKQTITTVAPNTPQAKTLAAASQQPLIGHVVDNTPGHVVIETASGQRVNVAMTNETKVLSQNTVTAPSVTPTLIPTGGPTTTPVPTKSVLSPTAPGLQNGATVALVGQIQGSTFTPSVVATNLRQELAAPQPVSVLRVNTKNNTMVVDENGTPVQVDLSAQTPIKSKDTNIPLQQVQPGSVVVVHGTTVEQVKSDTPQVPLTPTVTPRPTVTGTQPTGAKTVTGQPAATGAQPNVTGGAQPTGAKVTTTGQPAGAKTTTTGQPAGAKTTSSPAQGVTGAPAAGTQTLIPVTPKVIQATSVQVVQQKPTSAPIKAPSQPSQPASQPKQQSQPAAPAKETKPQQPAQVKKTGK